MELYQSDSIKQLVGAIHKVQQGLEILKRESTADAGKFSYKYTSFAVIWLEIKPLLKQNGLTIMQSPIITSTGDALVTEVYHNDSGQWKKWSMRLVTTKADPQSYGSAITYAERYMIKTIFKAVTDDDNDATTHRLADGEQRKDWVRAFTVVSKKVNPDSKPTYNDFAKFILEIYGKPLNSILASESQTVLDTINAFDTTNTNDEIQNN